MKGLETVPHGRLDRDGFGEPSSLDFVTPNPSDVSVNPRISRRDFLKFLPILAGGAMLTINSGRVVAQMLEPGSDKKEVLATIGEASSQTIGRFLQSGRMNRQDAANLLKEHVSGVTIAVNHFESSFVLLKKPNESTAMYMQAYGRFGTEDWIRLHRSQDSVPSDLGQVAMTRWLWDIDTIPWTTEDNYPHLSYPTYGADWQISGFGVECYGHYPDVPDPTQTILIPGSGISAAVRNTLIYVT